MPDISSCRSLPEFFGVSVDSLLAGNSGGEMIQHVTGGDVEDYIQGARLLWKDLPRSRRC